MVLSVIDLKGKFNALRYGLPTFSWLIPFTVKTQRGANDTKQGDKGYLRPTYGSKGESLVGIELYSSTFASHTATASAIHSLYVQCYRTNSCNTICSKFDALHCTLVIAIRQ